MLGGPPHGSPAGASPRYWTVNHDAPAHALLEASGGGTFLRSSVNAGQWLQDNNILKGAVTLR